jgi:hypothetical protein
LTLSEIVLHQWQEIIAKFSSLIFIIVHEKRSSNLNLFKNWVSVTIIKKKSDNLKNWFSNLQYIFDTNNSRAFRVIILSFYEIFVVRILTIFIKRIKFNKEKKIYESKWTEVFNMILLNENHWMRHSKIKTFANVQCLKTNIHWFVTITFVINSSLI